MHRIVRLSWFGVLIYLLSCPSVPAEQPSFQWGRQFGADADDFGKSIAMDSDGNILITGWTTGDLAGKNLGGNDLLLYKLSPDGDIIWSRQVGTAGDEQGNEIAVDRAGNSYIAGWTNGGFGGANLGGDDIFLAKFDRQGNQVWVRQTGTSGADQGQFVDIDADGHIYITGSTGGDLAAKLQGQTDVFVLEYDAGGTLLSQQQFGWEKNDSGTGIAFDGKGNVYVCGQAEIAVNIGGAAALDGFVARIDTNGTLQWRHTFNTPENDNASSIRIDKQGFLIVGGSTAGSIGGAQAGNGDAFIAKFDTDGNKIWADQFGRGKWDGVLSVIFAADGSDDIVISGCQNWDTCEGYCRRYDSNGALLWTQEYATQSAIGGTCGKDVVIDAAGNCYHVGGTQASVFSTNAGKHDVYVVKIIDTGTTARN